MVLRTGSITTLATMSRAREEALKPEIVRPRRTTRRPSHLHDYEISYTQKQLTFEDEQSDMLACMHEMRDENRKMRQDMQRLSDIIANSPVLASQASVSVQQPLDEGAGVWSTPKSTSMQASFQDDGNPSQAEHTPLVPLRDESLHAICGCEQDHIEELTSSLKRLGRWSDSQTSSGMSTPSYTSPHDSKKDSPHQTVDTSLLRPSMPPLNVSYNPTTDPYYRHSSDRVRSLQEDALIDRFDHSSGNWRQECSRDNKQFRTPDWSYHSLGRSENYRPMCPPSLQYRGPTPTIPHFSHDDPWEFARHKLALDNVLHDDASESFKFQILLDHLKLEDALLVADSYSHSRTPFSDTMRALTDMYGQPYQLALQRITNLMDRAQYQERGCEVFQGICPSCPGTGWDVESIR